ncbi:hypothetical protein T4B_2567 [Trichinella pseudospiralis]|uniref:Uncharacterized protein n=1 Tax=Trichinella pseudospiralis TaxID=6337 RepID=A0A0V1JAH6_TRIPS|nr:hypothetical protein T4B_2567 [Trichinella pseudospiralis]
MDFIGRRGNVDVILPSSMKQNVSDVSAENYCSLICELVDKSDDGIVSVKAKKLTPLQFKRKSNLEIAWATEFCALRRIIMRFKDKMFSIKYANSDQSEKHFHLLNICFYRLELLLVENLILNKIFVFIIYQSKMHIKNYVVDLVDGKLQHQDGTALKSNSVVISPLLSVQFGRHHLVQFTIVLQDFNADE